jgi:hypothetical protein
MQVIAHRIVKININRSSNLRGGVGAHVRLAAGGGGRGEAPGGEEDEEKPERSASRRKQRVKLRRRTAGRHGWQAGAW